MRDQDEPKEQELLEETDSLLRRPSEIKGSKRTMETLLREGEACRSRLGDLEKANAELATAMEEIAAAEEELRIQNEELMTAQQLIDFERKRYQDLFELAPDGSLITDARGIIKEANGAAEVLFGLTRNHLKGMPLVRFVAEGERQEFLDHLSHLSHVGDVQRWEVQLNPRESAPLYASISVAPVKGYTNEQTMFRWIFRDNTGQRRMESELQRSNRDLEEFAFIASHDMQEPLRKVSFFGNMLEREYGDRLDAEGRDYLERMLNATQRMQQLLTALLEYSRVGAGSEPLAELDLNQVAQEVLSDLEVRLEQEEGRVVLNRLPIIEARPSQIRQLFQNLIGNALKFHGEEKPLIHIYSKTGSDHCSCCIYIEDNGIGFDERHIERIFAPLQRLHGRDSYEGTGMGLAICQKIIERHGGTITATSRPGAGSTFIITLPIRQPQDRSSKCLKPS